MPEILELFAGVTPKNNSITVCNDILYYISSSNIIACDSQQPVAFMSFSTTLTCIYSYAVAKDNSKFEDGNVVLIGKTEKKHSGAFKDTLLAMGDSLGNGILILNGIIKKYNYGSKIQDCCVLNDSTVVFCILGAIYVQSLLDDAVYKIECDYIISSVECIGDIIFVGCNIGVLYLYRFTKENSIQLYTKVDCHLDNIRKISINPIPKEINTEKFHLIATCSQDFNVKIWKYDGKTVELLQTLNGHSNWVNNACWRNGKLYSVSSDKTARVWELSSNQTTEFYTCTDMIGAASELVGVAFIEGRLITQAKTGGIDKQLDNEYYITGHLSEVTDIDWKNEILLSGSLDQTTRLFYMKHECARAQIHGFSITSVKFLPGDTVRFISSAQETIIRVFEATQAFFNNCIEAKSLSIEEERETCKTEEPYNSCTAKYVASAHLAELNLTNEISTALIEDPLSENSLSTHVFKEIKKIYGHYFEVKNIAVGKDLILSCNRSATKKFAGLFFWNLDGEKLQYIEAHELDIQRIAISSDEKYVLTVGRDQLVFLYLIEDNVVVPIKKFTEHSRVVWDCAFSNDSTMFATCSRDGKLIIYDTLSQTVKKSREFNFEITTVDFSPNVQIIVVGTSTGSLLCLDFDLQVLSETKVSGKKINIARYNESGDKIAIGGSDGAVIILSV
ncbi:Elongator subunit elp2 [Glugoides intestinalis]